MIYNLQGQEVAVKNLDNKTNEIAVDMELYGQTVRFIVVKQAGSMFVEKNVIVNPETEKEQKLSFTRAITNSDYVDMLNFARKNLA